MRPIVRLVGAAIFVLGLLTVSNASADTDLTGLVNLTFGQRTEDPALHRIAHERAEEIVSDWSHDGMRPDTAEVLAYNGIGAARAVEQWVASAVHNAVLSDDSLTRIGCGSHVAGGLYWAACVLAREPAPAPVPAPDPVPTPAPQPTPAPVVVAPPPIVVTPTPAGEPIAVARTPNPQPVGAVPTAGAQPVLIPNTALPEIP